MKSHGTLGQLNQPALLSCAINIPNSGHGNAFTSVFSAFKFCFILTTLLEFSVCLFIYCFGKKIFPAAQPRITSCSFKRLEHNYLLHVACTAHVATCFYLSLSNRIGSLL